MVAPTKQYRQLGRNKVSLKQAVQKQLPKRPPRLLDRIYHALDKEDQAELVHLINDPTISAYTIADALTELGHQVGYSTISNERRRGWEPM